MTPLGTSANFSPSDDVRRVQDRGSLWNGHRQAESGIAAGAAQAPTVSDVPHSCPVWPRSRMSS
jgi:hypothetical protein